MEKPIYQASLHEVKSNLNTDENGLSSSEAQRRIEEYGYNEISEGEKRSVFMMFIDTFKDPMVIILFIVAIIQILLGETIESIVIIGVVLFSSIIQVVQEIKAQESLDSLRNLSAPTAQVLRDGSQVEVEARQVVPGDIVILEGGDYVPADGRILSSNSLQIEEGALTGESVPADKKVKEFDSEAGLGDQKNMVFSSTLVTNGNGRVIITGTGDQTEMGKIAQLISSAKANETPLQRKLAEFTKYLSYVILALSALIFALSAWRALTADAPVSTTEVLVSSFMFAVAVAVAMIPEALQSIVTIVLSNGTSQMAKKHAIVRKLYAVETLGSASIICTDKTGTLTQNKMTVVNTYTYGEEDGIFNKDKENYGPEEKMSLQICNLANNAIINDEGQGVGDPTETALISLSEDRNVSYEEMRQQHERVDELPFDSERKLMSSLNDIDGELIMLTKGGPDVVIDRASHILLNGEIRRLEDEHREAFIEQNERYAREAKRVLALAFKPIDEARLSLDLDDEYELVLVGLVAMIDPPREEVYDAIAKAKSAGIRTIMITGDHRTTAQAIAEGLQIFQEGDLAITGKELDHMTDEDLDRNLEKISVYARVSPENKIRIVDAWQERDRVTAMTGDGVNDAPALKKADIGIAMGTGTDVAKDASAMILTDDNFATIVKAVEVGRNVYNNIKKSISYLFSGNLGAVISIVFALLAGWANPFTALQLLYINLVNDSIPAIALGMEPAEGQSMKQPPRDPKEGIFAGGLWQDVLFRGSVIAVAVIISQYIGLQTSPEIGVAMAFTTLILARTLQMFAARSRHETAVQLGFFSNKYLIWAFIICMALYSITLLPGVREIFDIPNTFTLNNWLIAAGLAVATTVIMEVVKLFRGNK